MNYKYLASVGIKTTRFTIFPQVHDGHIQAAKQLPDFYKQKKKGLLNDNFN